MNSKHQTLDVLGGLKNYVFLNPFASDMIPLRSAVNFDCQETSDEDSE